MARLKFGPAGLGPIKEAIINLKEYKNLGLEACEISFTYGAYIKEKQDAIKIGKAAKDLGIFLSIHAPYYVNLNSKEKEKIDASKKRILRCCEVGHYLQAKRVVFHPGYYSNMSSETASDNIIKAIKEIQSVIKKKSWNIELCAETMGKKNVFGSIEEISNLIKQTGCSPCIDFAHILARSGGNYRFNEIKELFKHKNWHCHFSGIVYGDKGEKHHIPTPKEEWEKLLSFLKTLDKEIVIACESPNPIEDSVKGLEIWKKLDY
jgi:deoxyribonuclease IV